MFLMLIVDAISEFGKAFPMKVRCVAIAFKIGERIITTYQNIKRA